MDMKEIAIPIILNESLWLTLWIRISSFCERYSWFFLLLSGDFTYSEERGVKWVVFQRVIK